MILEIPKYTNKSIELSKECEEVVLPLKREVREFVKDLKETCLAEKAFGVAAPQVGRREQIAVINSALLGYSKEWVVLINPQVGQQPEDYPVTEGIEECLSYPGLSVRINRPAFVRVVAYNEYGHHTVYEMDGAKARVFMHEIDHLAGICVVDYIGFYEDKEEFSKRELNLPYLDAFEHLFEARKGVRNAKAKKSQSEEGKSANFGESGSGQDSGKGK